MNKHLLVLLFCFFFSSTVYGQNDVPQSETQAVLEPVLLNKEALSGLGLKAVKAPWDPDRKLFQKALFTGKEISIFIVSSETKTATWKDYGIEEFIYVINGQARLKPFGGEDLFFPTGSFFVAPRGYDGEWETQGGVDYYHELSVITNKRPEQIPPGLPPVPYRLDETMLSGLGLSMSKKDSTSQHFYDQLYIGHELTVWTESIETSTKTMEDPMTEQLIYVISGNCTITAPNEIEKTFNAGDFFVIPQGFRGRFIYRGHKLFRSLNVKKSVK